MRNGVEVAVAVCVALRVEVVCGVIVTVDGIEVVVVEQDTRMNTIWSLASKLANIREQAPVEGAQ